MRFMKFSIFLVKMSLVGDGTIGMAGRWYVGKSKTFNESYEQILKMAADTIYVLHVKEAYEEYKKHYAHKTSGTA